MAAKRVVNWDALTVEKMVASTAVMKVVPSAA